MTLPGPRGWQPDAFIAHMREVLGELDRRGDRRLVLRARVDLPERWTSADSDVRPRVAWTSPHGLTSEALGVARQAPLTRLRWQDDAPHPDDLAVLRNWLAQHPFLTDALLACGFPQREARSIAPQRDEGSISVPLWLWLPRLWLHSLPGGHVEASVVLLGSDEPEAIYAEVAQLLTAVQPAQMAADPLELQEENAPEHAETIAHLLSALRAGEAQKVVWSRAVQLPGRLPRSALAQRMRLTRPDAWNIDVQLPNGENFLGATPELLVACREDRITAMALAGTGSRAQLLADDARLHDEHDRVRHFVEHRLEALGVTALETQSDVAQAGALNHRRTAMTGTRPRHLDALTAALTLHPTPALLGLPRAEALAMIEQVEPPRGLYGGCLGRLASDGSGQGEVVVLLRGVMQHDQEWQARAGAGLVPGSIAADEAREIAQKLAAILASLLPVLP